MRILYARRLLTHNGTVEYPVITLNPNGTIADIESDPTIPETSESADTLAPTFLDIHTHGAAGYDVMDADGAGFAAINTFLARHGVGHYLPTTVTAPVDTTLRALTSIAGAIDDPPMPGEATPIGIHLEGPFISHAKRGIHPAASILAPDTDLFDRFQQAARGHIRLITLAPEARGALDLIRHVTAQGVCVSIGHTDATTPEAQAAIGAGATSATHTFNAMRPIDHRAPGVLATVLDSDSLFAELICDGIHVAPELVRLWLKVKGPDRAILVTDAMAAAGMPDGTYILAGLEVAVTGGRCLLASDLASGKQTLAGSVLTMDRAVANLQRFTAAPLATALRLASTNPRRLLGLDLAILPGAPANFNRFNATGTLTQTMLRGAS